MTEKINVAVLFGGRSGEHEVSLLSARSVLSVIDRNKYNVTPIGITKQGQWLLGENVIDCFEKNDTASLLPAFLLPEPGKNQLFVLRNLSGQTLIEPFTTLDVIFPVMHGTFGEDGTVQGLLETADLPYVGADVLGSAVGMDKEASKRLWLSAGLPVVDYISVGEEDISDGNLQALTRRIETRFGWPCFIKPSCSGSSVGTSKVSQPEMLKNAVASALRWSERALVEAYVEAREIECAVLGNEHPVAFPPGEVVPSHEFYDYEAKYKDPNGATLLIPAPLAEETRTRIMSLAVAAYKYASIKGMARVDFFVEKLTGAVFLNEINTIPGFTAISMYPQMCIQGGLAYPDLLDKLIELGLENYSKKRSLEYDFSKS